MALTVSMEQKKSLASHVGAGAILDDASCRFFNVDGQTPSLVLRPQGIDEVQAILRWCSANGLAVLPWGNGTLMHIGYPPERYDVALQLDLLNRVIDYPADDLTVTVEAGCKLDELQRVLGEQRQYLPLDAPSPEKSTIGGLIATNAGGARRFSEGTMRDLVLGIAVVNAEGALVRGGARVVKNAAGFDTCRLFTGSFGTLGVIVEATLKLRPLPETLASAWIEFASADDAEAGMATILDSNLLPASLEYLNGNAAKAIGPASEDGWSQGWPAVLVGFEDNREAVEWQVRQLRALLGPHLAVHMLVMDSARSSRLQRKIADFRTFSGAHLVFKANLLSSQVTTFVGDAERSVEPAFPVEAMAHAGNGVVYLRVRGDVPPREQATIIREWSLLVIDRDGTYVIEKADPAVKAGALVFGPERADVALMRKIKNALDPNRLLSPGRFVQRI